MVTATVWNGDHWDRPLQLVNVINLLWRESEVRCVFPGSPVVRGFA